MSGAPHARPAGDALAAPDVSRTFAHNTTMIFRFGRYELDDDAGELRREGAPVAIQPKPLALLGHLIRERDRVVPQDELFDLLWPGVAVTPSSLTRAVSVARNAIGDTHRGDVIRSVARRGYRFSADVIVLDGEAPRGVAPAATGIARKVDARGAFVGRDEARARLRDAFTQAAGGEGVVAVVTGAAGIGKTRLGELFAAELADRGALVLVARAREGEGVPALWLWAQVLRALAAESSGDESKALAATSSALADLVPELAGDGDATPDAERPRRTPEQSRFQLFEDVTRALVAASRRRPLLLVLEDLHWAGSASLRLLEHLAFEIAHEPLLVLATVRDEKRTASHPIERTLTVLRQQPLFVEVALRGFSRAEVAQLLENVIGRPAPPDLTSELFARTEGVPLLLREALRLLAERGDLQRPEGVRRWAVSLPTHALDLIRRPLARLSPPCGELLAAASVLGREFTLAPAAAVADIAREAALDLVDEAESAGVIESVPEAPASWRFSHALFQEAVYAGLPAGRRARLHARAALELERRHAADPDRVIAELAHHHHESLAVGDPGRAFACALRAAARAQRVCAFEQVATHFEQAVAALDHAEPVDAPLRLATLLDLGDALQLAGERARRRAAFASAMEAARTLARPLDFARAAIGFCDLSEWAPEDAEALAGLDAALAMLPEDADSQRAHLLTRLAYLGARRNPRKAIVDARGAVELARRTGDPGVLQDAIYALHFLLAGPDHLDEREALAREAAASAQTAYARDTTLVTVLDVSCDFLMRGNAEAARRERALAGALAGTLPRPGRAWGFFVYDAGFATLEGRFDEAERLIDEAFRIGRRIEHPFARGVQRAHAAMLARERGDDARAFAAFNPTSSLRPGPMHWSQAFVARALVALGRNDDARAVLDELAARSFEGIPRNIRWHGTVVELAHLCVELGDAERAATLRALLLPIAREHGLMPLAICYGGPVSRALARIAETLGEDDEAQDRYDDALGACSDLGARPTLARVQVESGGLVLRRGDKKVGRARIAEGVALAEALGMRGVVAAGRALLERAKG